MKRTEVFKTDRVPDINRPKTFDQALDVWGGKRPKPLNEVAAYYDHQMSVYPDMIRVSFEDGNTAVYELRAEQPHPIIVENINIIRKWKQGYVNQPRRRRKP